MRATAPLVGLVLDFLFPSSGVLQPFIGAVSGAANGANGSGSGRCSYGAADYFARRLRPLETAEGAANRGSGTSRSRYDFAKRLYGATDVSYHPDAG